MIREVTNMNKHELYHNHNYVCLLYTSPLHSDWIRIMGLNGLENMISVPMNFLMETEEDRKVGKIGRAHV